MSLEKRIQSIANNAYEGNEEQCSGRIDGIFESSDEARKVDVILTQALDALKEADNGLIYWEPIVGRANKARITNKVKLSLKNISEYLEDYE